jgi:outer membrane protein OmpA-like peptidoglycan-associated protein
MKHKKATIIFILFILFFGVNTYNSYSQMLHTVVALTGNVFDAVTKEPVTVFIIVHDENGDIVGATRSNKFENGNYYVTGLKPGNKYTIILKQQKYFMEKYNIQIANTNRYEEISRDFLVKPLYEGVKIPFPVPPFELNKSKLRYGAEEILTGMSNTLVNNEDVDVEIHCYPDDRGNKKENIDLTSERCKSLMNYFTRQGIEASRLSIKPHENTDPDNPPPTKKRAKGKRYIGSSYIVVTNK